MSPDVNDILMQDTSVEAAGASNGNGARTEATNTIQEDVSSHGNKENADDASDIRVSDIHVVQQLEKGG